MDRGAWQTTIHGIAELDTEQLTVNNLSCFLFMSFLFMCCLRYNVYAEGYNLHLVQCSPSVISDSLQPHGLQHARLTCPSPTPGAYSDSCPLSQ